MPGLKLAEVAAAVGAAPPARTDRQIGRVVTDSRDVREGDLFVALKGARTDGHAYLEAVAAAGACAALVQADRGARPAGLEALVVPDPLAALGALARYWLGRLGAPVVGITGSVGKTTAKDFLCQLLGGAQACVHAAPASYNSEVGLPLAVLAAPPETRLLVLEYGINEPGEMERLLAVASPQHAWLTAISEVHLEGMRDLATIAREKARLLAAVPPTGTAWLTSEVAERVGEDRHALRASLRVLDAPAPDSAGACRPGAWRLRVPDLGPVTVPVIAPHEAELAFLAANLARELGVGKEELRARLETLRRPPGRLSVREAGGATFLDDAYNASPAATEAALAVLASWPHAQRRIAVLGTMHELGPRSEALHRAVGRAMAAHPVHALVAVGEGGGWIADGADEAGGSVRILRAVDRDAAGSLLASELVPRSVVLLKASRAERLEELLRAVSQTGEAGPMRTAEALP